MREMQTNTAYDSGIVNPDNLSFKEYILANMKVAGAYGVRKTVTSAELADTLGVSTKVFQEILNGRRSGPDRRDFIIGLCAQLQLDADETQEALRLYPGFQRQLMPSDPRDRHIIRFLNADFDSEISCEALNRYLRKQNLPALKIRYRNPSENTGRKTMENRKINWALRSEAERQRYNYYTSLDYDDVTASVLALYTYGEKRIPTFRLKDVYQAFAEGKPYPHEEEGEYSEPKYFYNASSSPVNASYCLEIPVDDADLPFGEDVDVSGGSADYGSQSPSAANPNIMGLHLAEDDVLSDVMMEEVDLDALDTTDLLPDLSFSVACKPEPEAKPRPIPKANLILSNTIYPRTKKLRDFLDLDTDEYNPIEEKDPRNTAYHQTSTFRMTTNTASVGILLNQLRNGRRITRDMVRIEEMLNYFRYQQEKPKEEMFRISTELKDQENGSKLLYINVQGKEEVKEQQNIVIVLDVSGSMTGNTEQTQAAIAAIVSKLKTGDTFSLITYSDEDEVVIDGLKIGSAEDITRILEKLLGLCVDGCTNGSAGIEKAYEIGKRNYRPDGNNQVILITDGDLNFGITSQGGLEALIEEKKKAHLFLSVIGTGLDNYKDNKLETLSKHGNGVYRVVNNLNDVKKSIRDEYASLVNVIAKDVKAQVEFNPEIVESFRLLGFENRELSHEDFTNDKVISEPFGSGGYGIALYEIRLNQNREQPESGLRYSKFVTTGSKELGLVKIRYKEPLEETSHEIDYVIPTADERYSDNLTLASIVYICAEKLRDSQRIRARDEALALAALEKLGTAIRVMNIDDLPKLKEILLRSKEQLHVGIPARDDFDW